MRRIWNLKIVFSVLWKLLQMWANTNRWVFARYCSGRRSRFGKRNYFRAKCTPQSRSGRLFLYLPWHRCIWEDCFRRHWPAYSTNRSITPKLLRVSLSAHGLILRPSSSNVHQWNMPPFGFLCVLPYLDVKSLVSSNRDLYYSKLLREYFMHRPIGFCLGGRRDLTDLTLIPMACFVWRW
jgi:hypothetical protein